MKSREFSFNELRSVCAHHLSSTKTVNAKYSLRKFAHISDIPVSTLSKFLNGKVLISKEQVVSLCKVLELSHAQTMMYSRALEAEPQLPSLNLDPNQLSQQLNHPMVDALIESLDSGSVDLQAWQLNLDLPSLSQKIFYNSRLMLSSFKGRARITCISVQTATFGI
jgi:transcriptional regulator with XRE-family HTH domain